MNHMLLVKHFCIPISNALKAYFLTFKMFNLMRCLLSRVCSNLTILNHGVNETEI